MAVFEASRIYELAGSVAYSTGSVVSKMISKKESGSITLFAFDKDQGLSEHTAPFDALVHVVEGEGEFTIGGETNQVGKGQLILMPANIPHALKANTRFKMILTMLRK